VRESILGDIATAVNLDRRDRLGVSKSGKPVIVGKNGPQKTA